MLDYIRVMRPDHWLKNIFIVFGHVVAIVLLDLPLTLPTVLVAALSLIPACLIASANYILNEILDAPFDRVHPTKKDRPVPSGKVKVGWLWVLMGVLCVAGFAMALVMFNTGYMAALGLLLASGFVYNVEPLRLKDRAFLDVIAESFNNPIRLWLGWYALAPATTFPPLSIVMAWWFFGALLMAGKRYAEYRFIGDGERSGRYRKSFKVYTEKSLVLSMVTYANFFCFCMGIAITTYRPNLVFVFPVVVIAILVYLNRAMTEEEARLEPEHLLKSPLVLGCTALVLVLAGALAFAPVDLTEYFQFFRVLGGD
jgi:4-hydroxybenzoate polyprenyltransferase